jgi:4a-hydroxytetrahydrobiopterin dehydratase
MPMSMEALTQKSCTPCRGGVPPIGRAEAEALLAGLNGWELAENPDRIKRTFRFRTFKEAFALASQVAALAEQQGHHPDVEFGWGYATVTLLTHKIDGLHENDFIMAAKIDALPAVPRR